MKHSFAFWEGYADAYAGRDMVEPSLDMDTGVYINAWLDYVEGYTLFLNDEKELLTGFTSQLPQRSEGDY